MRKKSIAEPWSGNIFAIILQKYVCKIIPFGEMCTMKNLRGKRGKKRTLSHNLHEANKPHYSTSKKLNLINKYKSHSHMVEIQMLRSHIAVNVMVAWDVVSDDKFELFMSEPEDRVISSFGSGLVLIFRSMKSEIKLGLVILLSSTSFSPVSIFTTVDIAGRSFGMSWVQRRLIFKNLQASSASKSPFSAVSTSPTNSLLSWSCHVCSKKVHIFVNIV